MKIKGNRFVTSILAASMLSGTFFVPASAGELEGESAIAGMAVTLNNYYAGEETPDEAILDYLVPKAQATSEAESETKENRRAKNRYGRYCCCHFRCF